MPFQFLTGALVARAIGPEGKGVLFLLTGLAGSIASFANIGTAYGAVYLYKKGRYTLGQITASSILLVAGPAILILTIFTIFSDAFIHFFIGSVDTKIFKSNWIWIPLSGILPTLLFKVANVLLIRDDEMQLYGFKTVGPVLINILLVWLLTLIFSWGVVGILWSNLISSIVGIIIPVYWLNKKGVFRSLSFSLNTTRDMLRVGLQQYRITLIAMVSKRFDAFIIAGLLSVQDAGYFAIAFGILNIFMSVPRATMWPLVSSLSSKDEDRHTEFIRASRILFNLALVLTILFVPFVPSFIKLVYGESYLPSIGAVWLILPGVIATPLIISANAYFTSIGKPGRTFIPAIISTFLQIVVSLTLVPHIGMMGSAIGISVNNIILAIMQIFLVARDGKIRASDMIIMSRKDWSLLYGYFKKKHI